MDEGLPCCPECGATGVSNAGECESLFQEVVGREFSQMELFQVHRLTVDSYSLQHPSRYMKSAKSAAAHLIGMCWAMEGTDDPAVAKAISRFLDGTPQLQRPEPDPPPGQRGALTIRHVFEAPDSEAHIRRVREWARTAWEAWAMHHPRAREWVQELQRGGRSGT